MQLDNDDIHRAGLYGCEAHGMGRREVKRKRHLD